MDRSAGKRAQEAVKVKLRIVCRWPTKTSRFACSLDLKSYLRVADVVPLRLAVPLSGHGNVGGS